MARAAEPGAVEPAASDLAYLRHRWPDASKRGLADALTILSATPASADRPAPRAERAEMAHQPPEPPRGSVLPAERLGDPSREQVRYVTDFPNQTDGTAGVCQLG